ncbi:glycosyltransferase [Priestia megaterium]
MVAKKPTIVSDTGGLSDIVSHFDTGLTFARGDTLELINCIEFLLKMKNGCKNQRKWV